MQINNNDSQFFDQCINDELDEEVEIRLSSMEQIFVNFDIKQDLPPPFVTEQLCYTLCQLVKPIFAREPIALSLKRPVCVIGDIHGQFHDLIRIMDDFGVPPEQSMLFLGDYVDRGPASIEVMCTLFWLKVRFPDKIFLLRGNHEFARINKRYGFRDECHTKFGHVQVYNCFNSVFSYMPMAAVIDDQFFCCHGGISQDFLDARSNNIKEVLNSIKRPVYIYKDEKFVNDLVWSDPLDENVMGQPASQNMPLFLKNVKRNTSCMFNCAALDCFLKKYSLRALLRGHQPVQKGIGWKHQKRCITIFSAPGYQGENNEGAVAMLPDCEFDDVTTYLIAKHYEPLREAIKKLKK